MGDTTSFGKMCLVFNKVKPFLAMFSLQFGYAGMYIVTSLSLNSGMNHYILATYRHVVATFVVAPFAFFLERKIRPKLTLPIFLRIMLLAFLEPVLDQNLYYMGLKSTSATFASAIVNVLPAITFILALIFRLETINLKKIYSVAKVVGTIITVSGAMVMTLYKGPIVDLIRTGRSSSNSTTSESTDQHWITGTLMLLGSCCAWAGFFILQSFTLKKYPAELSLTALICLMGMLENGVVSLVMVRDMSAWKLGWDSRLLAAVYSGVVCSGIAFYVQGVVIKQRGPVFVTSFSPLCMILTAALGAIVLAEQVHLGSIIGACFIVMGLYTVVWGKSKDYQNSKELLIDEKIGAQELPIRVSAINDNVDNTLKEHEAIVKIPAKIPLTQNK
ncbi:EamA domain-containing protein [Cephalotus follicularis]|uniref:WAT1-related protein n=1 Tax=Cephalotus follicularis TaxID=3775 RepID=A0A1Q3CV59_CEPFO|nr:EamA domain-containing protein [Cephalotus follicularis]